VGRASPPDSSASLVVAVAAGAAWMVTRGGPRLALFAVTCLGLGLALADRLARAYGGRVSAENLPEGGFRFRLVLPAAPATGAGARA